MSQNTQNEPYYALHRSFVHRYRMRRARALGVGATMLAAWYAVMHDIASNAASFGEFTTDVRAFVEAVGEPPRYGSTDEDVLQDALLADAWRMLAAAKVVEIVAGDPSAVDDHGLPSEFRVRVLGVADVNAPRRPPKSGAQRTAEWKARQKVTPGDDVAAVVTLGDGGNASPSPVTSGVTSDEDPPTHPPTHTTQPMVGLAHVSAPAREAGPSPLTIIGKARGRIGRARRELGSLTTAAEAFVGAAVEERLPRRMDDQAELVELWEPLVARLHEHGPESLSYGLAKANEYGKPGMAYLDACIATHQKQKVRPVGTAPASSEDPALIAMWDDYDPGAPGAAERIAARKAAS
ncbi:MAG: hypothetical protein JWM98_1804 [Thermoleophilia bacterium]|nr:hypothetical protein [Thermoleophilia bacterium]